MRWHFDLPQFTHTQAEEHRPGHRWSQTDFHSQLSPDDHGSWVVSSAVLQPLKTLPVLGVPPDSLYLINRVRLLET